LFLQCFDKNFENKSESENFEFFEGEILNGKMKTKKKRIFCLLFGIGFSSPRFENQSIDYQVVTFYLVQQTDFLVFQFYFSFIFLDIP